MYCVYREVPTFLSQQPTTLTRKSLWPPLTGYQKKEQSVVGTGCEVGDKVTMKMCTIGRDCSIGAKVKMNNCVLMNGVKIGDGYVMRSFLTISYNY